MSARSAQTSSRVMQNETQRSKTVWKAAAALCAAAFSSVRCACRAPRRSHRLRRCRPKSAALLDGMTGECLYAKNGNQRALIASTTKIMTGLLVCEADELEKRDRAGRSRRTGRLQYVSEKWRDADTQGPALRHDAPFRQ